MKKKRADAGVSEIIGTILMLGMAIALFSGVSLIIISYPLNTPSPQVDIVSYIEGSDIIFEHHGGPSLQFTTQLGITVNGTTFFFNAQEYINEDLNQNNLWDIGEQVIYTPSDLQGFQVDVLVIDYDSNSVLMMGRVQDGEQGEGPTIPSLNTFINPIVPYEKTVTPVSITADGDSDLDNVSVYYRWSSNNWSETWTTLTFDDFEGGFGNYTDGGTDCSLYTGGTYAHQGSNAGDIQDDTASSCFYHTSGIDVDTPGYTSIKVDFWFYADGNEPGEGFWVQYFDGSIWNIVAAYAEGVEFVNGQFYHEIVWINETGYTFPSNMQIKFQCNSDSNWDDFYIDEVYVNATGGSSIDWTLWADSSNPDTSSPWSWSFDFPNGTGYYEFYSIGTYDNDSESAPSSADAICKYNP